MRGLIIALWSICIVVAITGTLVFMAEPKGENLFAAIFWWAVVVGTYYLNRRSQRNAR